MYVLHLHWRPPAAPSEAGEVIVWVENGTLKQPRKRKITVKTKPPPFDDIPAALLDAIAAAGLDDAETRPIEITLLLPTGAYGPRPSPQLQHGWTLSDDNDPPVLSPWKISGLSFSPQDGFTLLTNLPSASCLRLATTKQP